MTASDDRGPLQRLADFIIDIPPIASRAERRYVIVGRAGLPLGAMGHAGFAVAFFLLEREPLFWFNVFSAMLWAVATWRVFRLDGVDAYALRWPFVLCTLVEIPAHAALATYYLGLESGFLAYVFATLTTISLAYFLSLRQKVATGAAMIAMLAATSVHAFRFGPADPLGPEATLVFLLVNSVFASVVLMVIMLAYDLAAQAMETRLQQEHDRAERLLLNILPEEIADRLKQDPDVIADEYAEASILFADIVGFTEASARMTPSALVRRLNRVFSAFDDLAAKHGLEKIKTIGDAYMVVAGLPAPRPDHAAAIVRLALDMLRAVDRINEEHGDEPVHIRIGVNSGPVIAGVIGHSKFAYDLWGDAVNVAARMEQGGAAGQIRITEATRQALGPGFTVTDEGLAEVKGKGRMRVFSVRAG